MKLFVNILVTVLALAATSCISQFTPEIESQSSYLTVDGLVTNENRSYSVTLGVSKPLDETSEDLPATGADVSVTDDTGNTWFFEEESSGYYVSDPLEFTGQTGRTYTLFISWNGMEYTSAQCILQPAPPIDSVSYEVTEREINASGEKEEIVRIALNTHDPASLCHYYRWTFEETWEIDMPFYNLPLEKRHCWMSDVSHNIIIANTEALTEDRIVDLTVTTFDKSTDRGQIKYSILVKQHSVSSDEYGFWDQIQTMSENSGGLYDVTPTTVTGNIQCTSHPGEIVLGYFSVSGVTSKRIFLRSPFYVPDQYKEKCVEDVITANPGLSGLGQWVFILNIYEQGEGLPDMWEITSNVSCTDCAYFASNVKPDYWDEGFGL